MTAPIRDAAALEQRETVAGQPPSLARVMLTFASMLCIVETLSDKIDKMSGQLETLSRQRQSPRPQPCVEKLGKEFYSVKEVAALIGTCDKTVRRLQKRGFFKSSKALRTKQIPRSEIDRYKQETV